MNMHKIAPYGSWTSPITADLVVGGSISLVAVAIDGQDIYWLESRPTEGGRHTIMRRAQDETVSECTPPDYYVRTTVHEYGGAAFTVVDGTIYFANYKDQRLYRQLPGGEPARLTPDEGFRYADIVVDARRRRLVCIREDHTRGGEPVNTIVAIGLPGGDNGTVLASGNDFYASPRLSPDGSQLAYLTWNHPNMPWDGCELWLADVGPDGKLFHAQLVAGGKSEAVFQPEWSPDGKLYFVAEPTGWWNLYAWTDGTVEALHPMQAEFGKPQWVFGTSSYGFASQDRILSCYTRKGIDQLAWLDIPTSELKPIASPYTDIDFLRCGPGLAVFLGGSPTSASSVVCLDLENGELLTVKQAFEVALAEGYLSVPESVSFPTTDNLKSHAFYYPPMNIEFEGPPDERPPLIVMSHGGPTSSAPTTLRYPVQYWTSRGCAVLDVNYGGSTGYGREYRRRLNGQWGVVDVDDCCNGALYLVSRGLVDRKRLIIKGGSAGGFTTFACLAFRNDVFSAGAAYFGVADLQTFVSDTHKFESRYLSTLVGPYPERKDLYFERSPVNFANQLACPLILFQGSEDKIVPPSQSQMMFDSVRNKGLPSAYLLFEGEQHGFRRSTSIKRSLEAELYFFAKVFGFIPADSIEPVKIENLFLES
jgi:dipeptidyl aminopeptidase/acylaminoacyl peptidase